jgi:hypothetical protein
LAGLSSYGGAKSGLRRRERRTRRPEGWQLNGISWARRTIALRQSLWKIFIFIYFFFQTCLVLNAPNNGFFSVSSTAVIDRTRNEQDFKMFSVSEKRLKDSIRNNCGLSFSFVRILRRKRNNNNLCVLKKQKQPCPLW